MVKRMMRWRPWSPASAAAAHQRAFEVRLVVRRVDGLRDAADTASVAAEVAWKGAKARIGAFRRGGMKRNLTRDAVVDGGFGVWDEEFRNECAIVGRKDGSFHPCEIVFTVFFTGSNQGSKKKLLLVGMASLNLVDVVSQHAKIDMEIPLLIPGSSLECNPSLHITLSFVELRTVQGSPDISNTIMSPVILSPISDNAVSREKDEPPSRAKFRKVKLFGGLVSKSKKNKAYLSSEDNEGRFSRNDESGPEYPCDTESLDGNFDEHVDDSVGDSILRRSFDYGCLRSTNSIGGSLYFPMISDQENYYMHRSLDLSYVTESTSSISEQHGSYIQKRSILPWRKRKIGFRSPKNKGEPLLKMYGEEGGDDIDFDRRQLSSFDESVTLARFGDASSSLSSHFGDDYFSVGSWVSKEFVSRDGNMRICTEIFSASIDQRSERAAGESACAVLVATIAEWFHVNQDMLPTRSEFDNLIREGSCEWRKLCENQIYRERFPDKHFDLETVLEAKIRPLTVAQDESFVGFFSPETTDDNNSFDFLNGAMSFDNIWDEISCPGSATCEDVRRLYIVSWNDHFFILMVERDACYIIDTLGERLQEGCNQAYILKFDNSTSIHKISSSENSAAAEVENTGSKHIERDTAKDENLASEQVDNSVSADEELVYRGKDSCKEYIKSFLAAIPIRELQVDHKESLTSTLIHRRLQIEFHSTKLLKEMLTQSVELISTTVESDLEFSSRTESDADFSSSPEPSGNFLWPVKSFSELPLQSEPTVPISLISESFNFRVKVN